MDASTNCTDEATPRRVLSWSKAGCVTWNVVVSEFSEVRSALWDVFCDVGWTTMTVYSVAGTHFILDVRCENARCVMMLIECSSDESAMWTLFAVDECASMVEILGEFWDRRLTTNDFGIVEDVFRQFFETGQVHAALHRSD